MTDDMIRMARASLRGPGAQPVAGISSLFLGGALLELKAPIAAGASLMLDLVHPALGAVAINVRSAWCRPLPGIRGPVVALEFHGSFDELVSLRHQLAAYLGSRVFDGPRFIGYVLREPNDPASACFDVSTAKVALILPLQEAAGFSVRWRDAAPGSPMPVVRTLEEAIQASFKLSRPPSLNVPGPAHPADERQREVEKAQDLPLEDENEELYGMNTVVLGPDQIVPNEGMDEEEILGANTLVLEPEAGPLKDDDSRVLGAGRVFGPSTTRFPHSKVVRGHETVAYLSRTAAEGSFNLYDTDGKKLALLARATADGPVQVCMMGDKASESLEFFTAENFVDGVVIALDLPGQPVIEPPLEGLG